MKKNNNLSHILKTLLQKYNITYNTDHSQLYIPYSYTYINKEFNYLKKNHIIGNFRFIYALYNCDILASKNNLYSLIEKIYGREKSTHIMPETWLINNSNHQKLFKDQYKKDKIYILKKNIQKKNGLLLTTNINDILYNPDKDYKIIQNYIKDVFLMNKNLRIYLLIISKKDSFTSYIYKNGKCMYTNMDYQYSCNLEQNITSYHVDNSIYTNLPLDLYDLELYFNRNNLNYSLLFQNIYNNIKLIHNVYKTPLHNSNNSINNTYFQLFGLDYIFDDNLNVYLLELNKGPDMTSKNDKDYVLKYRIYEDLLNKVGIIRYNKKNMFEKIA
jgi:hypothetical protein